ncbi:DNA 3'-5' helicase (plasmid) [Cupriavidus necator H16]|uniref:DNA 3'-5' helicase n=1 Tax=Cupriavidus necator (strain ATCC 17699 / DSM 428 / KCTC 22496 / NCIMB 10442 / H16 / Stanier 337) TaxID=381666 RepID=Q7WXG7_CUPNH|nr:ATP-dependent helicase [Cupriavidus necator]AAP85919.1 putative helicase, superfamily I [Cupriavidus necator H16]QCC05415.1 ATP-dependent helicase [Cupriavidus necator H16]QQB81586.1 ATP-dependent helicase [Cupriavidus necator]
MSLPPRRVPPGDWQPVGVHSLEPNALTVVRSAEHRSVLAGPGAGKTELLAQRAAFLLQTGASPAPQRILAISFKRDAARNLARRVRQRCHPDHASRFDSLTFDAFAKSLVDRFGQALPNRWRPTADYGILFPKRAHWADFLQRASLALDNPFGQAAVQGLSVNYFERRHVLAERLPEAGWTSGNAGLWAGQRFWDEQLRGATRSHLTFPMLSRLAELLVRVNASVRNALALTYSHVFMDEFQDTTEAQFDLVQTIFLGMPTILTAVGDNKQQIMRFALAMDDPFGAFEQTFGAQRIPLLSNYRSSPELVRIQHVLAQALDTSAAHPQSKAAASISDACCAIWDFSSVNTEAQALARYVASQMREHQLQPNDFVLLVRQKAEDYARVLAPAFATAGIPLRNEAAYVGAQMLQELLTEPLSELVLLILRLACAPRGGLTWIEAQHALANLRGIAPTDDRARRVLAQDLDAFARRFIQQHPQPPETEAMARAVIQEVEAFLGRDALIAAHTPYGQGGWLAEVENSLALHLQSSAVQATDWAATLDAYEGTKALPLMTLHKSKGLEYHTVIFIGLDDSAWWSFVQDTVDATAGFFVAFTRAKQRVIFTYTPQRGARVNIAPLYGLLATAGVQTITVA